MAGYELARMTDAERVAWVEQWLTTWPNGIQQYQSYDQSRQQFLADHPEYQDFKTYQGAVYDDPRGFRTQLAKTDPNFQRAMEAEQELLVAAGGTWQLGLTRVAALLKPMQKARSKEFTMLVNE